MTKRKFKNVSLNFYYDQDEDLINIINQSLLKKGDLIKMLMRLGLKGRSETLSDIGINIADISKNVSSQNVTSNSTNSNNENKSVHNVENPENSNTPNNNLKGINIGKNY